MARMFPERLPDATSSDAERRLFEELRARLSEDFLVIAQLAWLSKRRGAGAYDGEADFVIAHPRHGVLIIEVKGGGIEFDGASRTWHSTDRHGVRHEISDPLAQARRSKFALRDKLRECDATRHFDYGLAHAVAFPDAVFEQDLGPDAPLEIVLDRPKLEQLRQSIYDVFQFHHGPAPPEPGDRAIAQLGDLLAPSWKIEAVLQANVRRQESVIRDLTEQQFVLLDLLAKQPRALISGSAGTGKTMLAVEKARRLSREGLRVLYTCFNTNLSSWAQAQLAGSGVEASHFHKLCYEYASKAGIALQKEEDSDQEFFDRFPDALLDATARSRDRFDAIIVDEGQDFREEWWVALTALLADPDDGILYIFYDDNQRIYGTDSPFPIEANSYPLTTNCRNTQKIYEAVMLFYDADDRPSCAGPPGEEPKLIAVEGDEDEQTAVISFINSLVEEQKVTAGDIAILTPHSRTRSVWRRSMSDSWDLSWDLAEATEEVICSSIYAFKGLERPVVVVAELQEIEPRERSELLYVAFSRARQVLAVADFDFDAVAAMKET